jgi:sensor domain CHASE-containing protein
VRNDYNVEHKGGSFAITTQGLPSIVSASPILTVPGSVPTRGALC